MLTASKVVCAESIFRIPNRPVSNSFGMYRSVRHSGRSNREYGPDLLVKLMENCGFAIERIWTEYSWSDERPEIMQVIESAVDPVGSRGSNFFVATVKAGAMKERVSNFCMFDIKT